MIKPGQFLNNKSVKEVVVEHESLLFVNDNEPLEVAFKKLVQNKVLAMPVYDSFKGEFKGLIGLLEVVNFIANLHWELLLESIPYREADMYVRFGQTYVEDLITQPHVKIHDTSNFAVVAKTLLSGDYRRIPVINDQGHVVHVITISEMVDMVYNGIAELDPIFLKMQVKDMKHMVAILKKVGDSKLDLYQDAGIVLVNQIAKAIEAFRLIVSTHVSAVPIVDGSDEIMGCVSVRHIRAISSNASDIKVLYDETCGEFIKRSTLTVADITVSKYDTLKTVIEKMYSNKIHRLWVIEDKKIVGALTVKNLFTEMLEF